MASNKNKASGAVVGKPRPMIVYGMQKTQALYLRWFIFELLFLCTDLGSARCVRPEGAIWVPRARGRPGAALGRLLPRSPLRGGADIGAVRWSLSYSLHLRSSSCPLLGWVWVTPAWSPRSPSSARGEQDRASALLGVWTFQCPTEVLALVWNPLYCVFRTKY